MAIQLLSLHSSHSDITPNGNATHNKVTWLLVTFALSAVAGVVILCLGGMHLFGLVGSHGFRASMACGGVLLGLGIVGILLIVKHPCRESEQEQHASLHSSIELIEKEEQKVSEEEEASAASIKESPNEVEEEKEATPVFYEAEEKKKYEGVFFVLLRSAWKISRFLHLNYRMILPQNFVSL